MPSRRKVNWSPHTALPATAWLASQMIDQQKSRACRADCCFVAEALVEDHTAGMLKALVAKRSLVGHLHDPPVVVDPPRLQFLGDDHLASSPDAILV